MHRKTQLFVTREALAALARDHRPQDAIANQVTFSVKEGAAFDSEGLAKGDVDLAPLFAPYLAAFRDLPADLRERTVLYRHPIVTWPSTRRRRHWLGAGWSRPIRQACCTWPALQNLRCPSPAQLV